MILFVICIYIHPLSFTFSRSKDKQYVSVIAPEKEQPEEEPEEESEEDVKPKKKGKKSKAANGRDEGKKAAPAKTRGRKS